MFLKPKSMEKQAEDKRAKVEMKRLDLMSDRLDVEKIGTRRQKQMELKRLTA